MSVRPVDRYRYAKRLVNSEGLRLDEAWREAGYRLGVVPYKQRGYNEVPWDRVNRLTEAAFMPGLVDTIFGVNRTLTGLTM